MSSKKDLYILLIAAICLSLMTACANGLVGTYGHKINKGKLDHLSLRFDADSTFGLYAWHHVLGYEQHCGMWSIKNDTVLLTTFSDADTADITKFISINESDDGKDSVKVVVTNGADEAIPAVIVSFNDTAGYNYTNKANIFITDLNGSINIKRMPVNIVCLNYIGIGKRVFSVNKNLNKFAIKINFDDIPRKNYLKVPNKLLKKGKKLYPVFNDTISTEGAYQKIAIRQRSE